MLVWYLYLPQMWHICGVQKWITETIIEGWYGYAFKRKKKGISMLMLSKYAVPESEKGCGIMSTSTSPSRIRQKLLIPGAFSSRGITLCGYEFAGHRYDWDKRPGWRDYPSSSSQVRKKKKNLLSEWTGKWSQHYLFILFLLPSPFRRTLGQLVR